MTSPIQVEPVNLEIRNLYKRFGTQDVLRGVEFSVDPGEIFVLMGPSGSGKSVLLRQVIGLDSADRGNILIGGDDASEPETHANHSTALVFQAGALLNSMSVYDNLALYLREHRLYPEKTIRKKVFAVMEALSIANASKKIPAELSGGMKKRVAVARAIIMEPQLILYDEPTSELDPILAATVSELIATVSSETGATSLVVTHDRQLATSIAHRVGVLFNGQLQFVGNRDELLNSEDSRVIEFMNPQIDLTNPRFRNPEEIS